MDRRDTILVADDVEINRAVLRSIFEQDFNVLEAENGEQALFLMRQYRGSIAVVLLDLRMPVKDGYQVMEERLKDPALGELPVAVITAEDTVESEVRAFDLGASDIIMKPFEAHVVRRRVQNIVALNRHRQDQDEQIREQARRLQDSNAAVIAALSSIIEYRSAETGQHIKRIQMFTRVLLEDVAKNCPELPLDGPSISMIVSASSLHDIGKIAIPDAILNKPGRLTPEEFSQMKTHTVRGSEILSQLERMGDPEYLKYAGDICLYHHERWDGRGYPCGLKGEQIPVCAQVVGIADCYDALTTDRVYRSAIPPEHAYNMILNGECGAFSPRILESFKHVREAFRDLTLRYADREVQPPEPFKAQAPGALDPERESPNTLQLCQMKYLTILRHIDATVMEVDVETGLYHLVYLSDPAFEPLRTGKRFEEALRRFVERAVCAEDREKALAFFEQAPETLLRDGQMRRECRFGVSGLGGGEPRVCSCALLRVDTGVSGDQKLLIIWKIRDEACGGADETRAASNAGFPGVELGGDSLCSLWDRHMTIRKVSPGLCALLGYSREALMRVSDGRYLRLVDPADRETLQCSLREQLREGKTAELEYRVLDREGHRIWLLDKVRLETGGPGGPLLLHSLTDITRSRESREKLERALERYRLILEQTDDMVLEWDIAEDFLTVSDGWERWFGYMPVREQISKRLTKASHIHPDDLTECVRLMEEMAGGKMQGTLELRVADASGRYRWVRARASLQVDEGGKPIRVVGLLSDIEEEKSRAELLRNRTDRDGLTGFYNRTAGRMRAARWLESRRQGEPAAVYLIDMDNFKEVNDRYGHSFGDVVLQEISNRLRRQFSSEDILIRVGGDEFLIVSPGVRGAERAEEQGRRIMESMQKICRENIIRFQFSCSIGISLCPRDGTDFASLYERGSRALQAAKRRGKNKCVLYGNWLESDGAPDCRRAENTRIDSEGMADGDLSDLAQEIFRLLYGSRNPSEAIDDALELVGRRLGLGRVSTCLVQDGAPARVIREWCNEGVSPVRELVCAAALDGTSVMSCFDREGIFCCPDTACAPEPVREALQAAGVRSVFRFALRDGEQAFGFISFDDCFAPRAWTGQQLQALALTAGMIAVFLPKVDGGH